MVGVGMIVALLPQRVYDATGTLESVSLIASVFAVTYLLTQLPVGFLSDRVGAKLFLVAGFTLCGVAGLVYFFIDSAVAILAGRMIQGVGEAPVWALGPAILASARAHEKGRAIGIYNASIHAGLMAGPVAGWLIAPSGQSQLPFLAFAALSFFGAALIALFLHNAPRRDDRMAVSRPGILHFCAMLRHRDVATILAGIVLYGACYGAFVSVLPISLVRVNGFDAAAISILFVVFYASISASQLVAGPLSDRLGRHRFMAGGLLLAASGFATFPFTPGAWAYMPLTLASFGLGAFCVASLSELNNWVSPELRGSISGSYYFAWALGYILGPLGIGYADSIRQGSGYFFLAACMAALVVFMRRYRE